MSANLWKVDKMQHYPFSGILLSKAREQLTRCQKWTSKALCWAREAKGFYLWNVQKRKPKETESRSGLLGLGQEQASGTYRDRGKHSKANLWWWLHNSTKLLKIIKLYTWNEKKYVKCFSTKLFIKRKKNTQEMHRTIQYEASDLGK